MRIETSTAARICNVAEGYFGTCLRALGLRRDGVIKRKGAGCPRHVFGARHVLAVLLVPGLEKAGCPSAAACAAAKLVGGYASDEALEAVLADGRSWVVSV